VREVPDGRGEPRGLGIDERVEGRGGGGGRVYGEGVDF
jgi:hypothetical protein